MDFLLVGIGGFLGAVTRYSFYMIEKNYFTNKLPWGTLIINALGCFIAGYCLPYLSSYHSGQRQFLLFLVMGFIGSFTTFSAFSVESFQLFKNGEVLMGMANIFISLFLGLIAVYLGNLISLSRI